MDEALRRELIGEWLGDWPKRGRCPACDARVIYAKDDVACSDVTCRFGHGGLQDDRVLPKRR